MDVAPYLEEDVAHFRISLSCVVGRLRIEAAYWLRSVAGGAAGAMLRPLSKGADRVRGRVRLPARAGATAHRLIPVHAAPYPQG